MKNELRNIITCDECKSEFYSDSSQMAGLCPECSHILYGYEKHNHEFANRRCTKCYWNGNVSNYLKGLKDRRAIKSKRILHVVDFFQDKYGAENILLADFWNADLEAIGLTEKSGQYLAYISTTSDKENNYHLTLENPSLNKEMPYLSAGEFDNLSLTALENIVIKHLKLVN